MTERADAIVIGLGTAGAHAAERLAAIGMRVIGLDGASADRAGARWVNGLPRGALAALGIDPPAPEHEAPFHLVAGWGPDRVTVAEPGIVDHDMRRLVGALQDRAREAGADLRFGARVVGAADEGGRAAVTLADGSTLTAGIVVDAAGMTGPTRRAPCPPGRVCVAAQEVRDLADPDAARAWLDAHRAAPGETLSFAGVAGGYSIVNVRIDLDPEPAVSLLTGSIPALGHPSGVALLQRFVARHGWVGARRFGGARPIPLTAAAAVVGEGRIARIGDAARQVYATHGSGILQGLRAAALLARTLADGGDPWSYNVRFQREDGATLAASAAFAAWTAHLAPTDVHRLIRAGLMHPALVADGLAQAPPRLVAAALPDLAVAAARAPDLAARLAPPLAIAARLQALHRRYPSDLRGVPAWHRARHRLLVRVRAA